MAWTCSVLLPTHHGGHGRVEVESFTDIQGSGSRAEGLQLTKPSLLRAQTPNKAQDRALTHPAALAFLRPALTPGVLVIPTPSLLLHCAQLCSQGDRRGRSSCRSR